MKAATGSLVMKLLNVPMQMLVGIVIARQLGPSEFGSYSFVIAAVSLLLIPAQMGFPSYLVRMVSVYNHSGAFGHLRGLIRSAYAAVALMSLGITGLAYLLVSTFNLAPEGLSPSAIGLGLVLIPLLALAGTTSGVLTGFEKVVLSQFSGEVVRTGVLLLLLGLLAVSGATNWFAADAVGVNVAATAVALVIALVLARRQTRAVRAGVAPVNEVKVWLAGALPFLMLAGAQVVNYYADLMMLTYMTSPRDAGLYRAAVQVADGMGMVLFAIAAAITPTLVALQTSGDWSRIRRLLVASHRVGTVLVAGIALAVWAFAPEVLELLYGAPYAAGSGALRLLVIGKAMYSTVAFGGVALSMLGEAGAASRITAGAVVLNVSLNALLIPRAGINGAAAATLISEFVLSGACIGWMFHLWGYDFSALGIRSRQAVRR